MVQHFNEDNFHAEVIEASKVKPVLVDFFAAWCGPCQMMEPIMEDVADEIGDKAIIAKVNVEESEKIAMEYGVMSMPTLIIFQDGQPVKKFSGVQMADELIEEIENFLKK